MTKPDWFFWGERDGKLIFIDRNTGQEKAMPLASDKQMEYLNKLRYRAGKKPHRKKLLVFKASAEIEKWKAKFDKEDQQTSLL